MEFRDKLNEWFLNNESATEFALLMWNVIQVWDDLIDRDNPVTNESINDAFYSLLCELPVNHFYFSNNVTLTPVISNIYLQWQTANALEDTKDRNSHNKAYVLRAGYYNLLCHVAMLTGGREYAEKVSPEIWASYSETIEDFQNAE